MSRRREQVLDAALDVLGDSGARGLTYQAVDAAARVPSGTASNWFRNRAALLRGALGHMLELDRLDWERFALPRPGSPGELAEALAGMARHTAGPGAVRTRARYALFTEAMAHPELAELLAEGHGAVLEWGADLLTTLGIPQPRATSRRLVDYLDGAVLHQLTFPQLGFDPEPGFRALLCTGDGELDRNMPVR